ncbi:MAG TPA: hypothetical protein VEU33_42390 [Archangium sp.]|nr:hypothetical protein [Archangium sp.]
MGIRGKGGKLNLDNEFVRAARNQADPCEWLAEQYRKASSSQEQLKIQAAQKVFECRNKQKRKSS